MIRHKIIFSAVSIVENIFVNKIMKEVMQEIKEKKPSQLRKALFEN